MGHSLMQSLCRLGLTCTRRFGFIVLHPSSYTNLLITESPGIQTAKCVYPFDTLSTRPFRAVACQDREL